MNNKKHIKHQPYEYHVWAVSYMHLLSGQSCPTNQQDASYLSVRNNTQ
jgi:hypothetical protein